MARSVAVAAAYQGGVVRLIRLASHDGGTGGQIEPARELACRFAATPKPSALNLAEPQDKLKIEVLADLLSKAMEISILQPLQHGHQLLVFATTQYSEHLLV